MQWTLRQEEVMREQCYRGAEAVRDAKLEVWMATVDKKLDTHNGYAERFAEIGENIAVIKNDIKTLYKKGE